MILLIESCDKGLMKFLCGLKMKFRLKGPRQR